MSLFMDEIDHQYVKALFPHYLLEQPMAYELWKLYFQHKKLFNKLKLKRRVIPNYTENGETELYRRSTKLTYATRKVIWEKLSQLGVLGIIPYDSATDEYLVQVYKYFYTTHNDRLAGGDHLLREGEATGGTAGRDEDVAMEERGEDYDEEDADDYEQSSDALPSDSDESALVVQPTQSVEPDHGAELDGGADVEAFYPAITDSKHSTKRKGNPLFSDVYSSIGYPLPHLWTTQSNNSVLVSTDGFTNLRPNPNWQLYSGYDNSPIVNNRLRTSVNNQKQQWASTWANACINHKKVAIFYYEIKVLSVTSAQSGQTCNINIGFKDWSKVVSNAGEANTSDPPSRDPGEFSALNRQTSNILRGPFEGSRPTSQQSSTGKDVYIYNGSDGYINDGSLFKSYSKPYGRDDVIGCGINYVDGTIFFTKNGIHLGTAFKDVAHLDLVPYVSLKPANSIRTNFGLYEEFLFDIVGYQNHWKAKAYHNIFTAISGGEESDFGFEDDDESEENAGDHLDADVQMNDTNAGVGQDYDDINNSTLERNQQESHTDGFLLSWDTRFSGGQLYKPDKDKINNISGTDDSIPCTLNTMINDYLIHHGLIDVAKGFLKDLQKDCIPNNNEERTRSVIRHHERQIKREEENLKIRQDIRLLIKDGDIPRCIKYIDSKFPGLLTKHVELAFEFKVAEYLLAIMKLEQVTIDYVLQKGLEISNEFIYNEKLSQELRQKFKAHFGDISALMAYDNPLVECPKELAVYLTPSYLQDRLFQLVNTTILMFLKKKSESSLENMISYTRAMVNTLMEYGDQPGSSNSDSQERYYKLVNIDEDLLNL
ncbi:FAFR242Cp [Eremothecium gossypii FDAG1]|nr:FAFR242Cp [Eremothecium gossypii FDAG1]